MKIVFLIRSLNKGGAELQLVTLADLLKKRGHEVKVAVSYADGYYKKVLNEGGISIIDLHKKSRWDIGSFIRLGAAIHKEKPDILHSYMTTSNMQASLIGTFFKKIKVVWGVRSSNMVSGSYSKLSRALYSIEPLFSKRADLIISNSEAARQLLLERGLNPSKIAVIYNGIDTDYYKENKDFISSRKLDDQIKIGTASRIDPKKGYEIFLSAIKIFNDTYPQQKVRFIAAGGGNRDYFNQLISRAKQIGVEDQILWLGQQDDMVQVLNNFDIYSSNSVFGEGFSNSIGQAMSCQVPCVVTDVGDSAKIVGDTGIVVKPGDSQGLAEAWFQMAGNDLKVLGQRARARIIENYSLEKLADHSEQALMDILNTKSTRNL
jgi:glycosyltransferase involved in cell wall biosynthesis